MQTEIAGKYAAEPVQFALILGHLALKILQVTVVLVNVPSEFKYLHLMLRLLL